MAPDYGIGFIGLGSIGQRMLKQAWHHPRVQPAVAWDTNTLRLNEITANEPRLRATTDAHDLINDDAVDVIYIASPPITHVQYAEAALTAGKTVLCEKPLGVDIAASESLASYAARSGIAHAVNFIFASARATTQIEQALTRVGVSAVRGVEAHLHLPHWAIRRQAEAPWLAGADQGGFVREVLSHFIYLSERLFGPAMIDYCYCREPARHGDAISGIVAHLTCGEIPISIHGSTIGAGPDICDYTVWGDHCSYRAHEIHGFQISTGERWMDANTPGTDPVTDWHQRQYDQLAAMLDGEPHTLPDFYAGLSVQKVIETLLAS
jgi:predicted dehydrogenase